MASFDQQALEELKRRDAQRQTTGEPPAPSLLEQIRRREAQRNPALGRAGGPITGPPTRTEREQALAEQVGETSLGEPGFGGSARDLATRADIALSTTFEEKRDKFLSAFPEGDFLEVEDPRGGRTFLVRRNPQEELVEFDPLAVDRIEVFGDIADLFGEFPSLAGEAVAAIIGRGSGFVRQSLNIAAGNVAGEAAKEALEEIRGFQRETFGDLIRRTGLQGTAALAGAVGSTLLTGPLNFARKGFRPTPSGETAMQAAGELDIPALTTFQIARSPLLRRLGGQSQATVSNISDYVREQQTQTVQALMRLRDPELERFLRGELQQMHDEASAQILAAAQALPSVRSGGIALREGVTEFDNFQRLMVDGAFSRARRIEEPVFNLTKPRDIASEVIALTEDIDVPKAAAVKRLAEKVRDFQAVPKIVNREGSGEPLITSVTDQIRQLRREARDLAQPAPGARRTQEELQAGRLEGILTNALKNPDNANPEFLEAWAAANNLARDRFAVRDRLAVIEAAKSERPANLVRDLAKPGRADDIEAVQAAIPESRFNEFREAVKADLLSPENVKGLSRRLDSFDQETLDLLLRPADQQSLRQIANAVDDLERVDIEGALARQSQFGALVDDLTNRGDTSAITTLLERAPEGSLARRSIRAGIMDNLFNKVVVRDANGDLGINRGLLTSEIQRLDRTGATEFLTSQDREVIRNLDTVLPFLREVQDSGTSLQAGETAAGIRSLEISAIATILENIGVARFMTAPGFNRFLARLATADLSFAGDIVRVAGATLTDAVTEARREQATVQSGRQGTGLNEINLQEFTGP